MATTKRKGPRPKTKSGKPRARKGVKIKPTELGATELSIEIGDGGAALPENARALAAQVAADGGRVLAAYKEPLGGHVQLFAALPIDLVEPTPYQRDVSDSHVRRLTLAMDRTRRYLDPVIAVRGGRENSGKYLTPNGNHRLTAMKELGAKTILTLLIPEPEVAFQILALNIEKAHNLREKSLEVFRMYGELARERPDAREEECVLEFEEPQLCTLGFAYSERGRLSGGAYQPFLKKVDFFLKDRLTDAIHERERRARVLLEFDEAVGEAVEKLKARGLTSPYLKAFVVARVNPLRFMKGAAPPFDELLATMTKRVRGMKADNIKPQDLARSGGAPDEEG
ncbi:MAG TPA: chromosome partitioning protein ParB [Polyangia bacterium]|jgi:ParB family chromosome partitioning protein